MPSRPLRNGLQISCVAFVLACTTAEPPFATSYHLKTVNGVALPFAIQGGSFDSGSMTRMGTDSFKTTYWTRINGSNGLPSIVGAGLTFGRFAQAGERVIMVNGYSTKPDTAFLFGPRLTLHNRINGSPRVDVFAADRWP